MFPGNFPVDGPSVMTVTQIAVVDCWQQVVVMEFGKQHDTTDTTDRANCLQACYGLDTGKLV